MIMLQRLWLLRRMINGRILQLCLLPLFRILNWVHRDKCLLAIGEFFFKSNIDKVYRYIRYQESQILRVSMKIRRENKKREKRKNATRQQNETGRKEKS